MDIITTERKDGGRGVLSANPHHPLSLSHQMSWATVGGGKCKWSVVLTSAHHRERIRVSVLCVCVCVWKRDSVCLGVCVCGCGCVCVCGFVGVREREREIISWDFWPRREKKRSDWPKSGFADFFTFSTFDLFSANLFFSFSGKCRVARLCFFRWIFFSEPFSTLIGNNRD